MLESADKGDGTQKLFMESLDSAALDADFDRSHSVIEQEDNFFFRNNLVLESDLRARLGDQTAAEIAKAAKKGFN